MPNKQPTEGEERSPFDFSDFDRESAIRERQKAGELLSIAEIRFLEKQAKEKGKPEGMRLKISRGELLRFLSEKAIKQEKNNGEHLTLEELEFAEDASEKMGKMGLEFSGPKIDLIHDIAEKKWPGLLFNQKKKRITKNIAQRNWTTQ